jgi:hypothetical protein
MRRVEVVEADAEAGEVALVALAHLRDQLLGRYAFGLGAQHDRRAVRVIGADEVDLVSLQALEAHPDVRLDVLHEVADVQRAIGVRKGGGDEKLAGH